jgi:hypothetical protein
MLIDFENIYVVCPDVKNYYYFCYYYLALLWFEFRDKTDTLPVIQCPQTFLALVIFQISSYFHIAGLSHDPPTYSCHVTDIPGKHYHPLFLEMMSCYLFAWVNWNHDPPDLYLSSSWDYRGTSSHTAQELILTFKNSQNVIPKYFSIHFPLPMFKEN